MVRHHGTEDNTLGQTIVKPTALGPVANTDTKLLIYGLFQKGRVLAQDEVVLRVNDLDCLKIVLSMSDLPAKLA